MLPRREKSRQPRGEAANGGTTVPVTVPSMRPGSAEAARRAMSIDAMVTLRYE
jgi:hypothetical protein